SRFLADRFGGLLVPHVRDTEAWTPERFDRAAARARLGVGDARVVMFLGTPRAHKGVEDLVEATAGLDGARLVVVGADPASAAARLVADPAGAAELGRRARARCAERYSFAAARAVLFPLIDRLAGAPPRSAP